MYWLSSPAEYSLKKVAGSESMRIMVAALTLTLSFSLIRESSIARIIIKSVLAIIANSMNDITAYSSCMLELFITVLIST